MTPQNDICPICNYGSSAIYCSWPSDEQIRAGVVPLDSLPAAWWNKMWADTTGRINEARDMVGQLITELNSVLAQAGICPQSACTDQLYQSINLIRQRLATASVAGSVISSSDPSKVAVANDGTMSVNCLGNATALTTSAHTIVGAINELKSTYDCCITDINSCTASLGTGKAPNMHASSATTYGVGNASCYGHVKLSDTYDSVLAACDGVAASQKALATAYTCMMACAGAPLGNTVGCALGVASAGIASTAARSDHVHPMPTCVANAGNASTVAGLGVDYGPSAYSIAARNSAGYLEAVIFRDYWIAENINSYSSPKLVFKGNDDGYLRNTDPAYVCVGQAGCLSGFENNNNVAKNANDVTYNAITYYGANGPSTSIGASTDDGALYSQAWSSIWVAQIAQDYRNGHLFVRGKNNGTWQPWHSVIDSSNIGSQSVSYASSASYATSAGSANTAGTASEARQADRAYEADCANHAQYLWINSTTWCSVWNWSGQSGQPSWLWGSNDGVNMYVWNPSNFSVNYANSAGSANTADYAYRIGADGGRWVACCNPQYGYYCCIYNPNDFDILAILPLYSGSGCQVCAIAARGWLDAESSASTGRGIRLN